MKRILFIGLVVGGFAGLFWIYSLAQPTTSEATESKLSQAAALIHVGQPEAAREVLATIPASDPDFAAGKYYTALALATAKDRLGFLKAMEKLPTTPANVPREVETDLAAYRIEALFFYRNFEEMLPRALAFQEQHTDSPHAAAVREYLLAALFERGLKKTFEACRSNDEAVYNRRWPEGKANLEQFLVLVASRGATNYRTLPQRNLQQDVWVARLTMGDEKALWGEVPANDAAAREQLSFLRLQLYQKLQKDKTDQNIRMAQEFWEQFPTSVHYQRVEFETADVVLCGAERLVAEARRRGPPEIVAEKRATAAQYLEMARGLFSRVVVDEATGIAEADVQESQIAMLRIYYAQRDWSRLSDWAAQLLATSPPEGKLWLQAKFYDGIGLASQRKLTEAAQALDEVLAIGFKGSPSYDGPLASAAKWRIHVAKAAGDETAARRVAEAVQNSKCVDSVKRTFLKDIRPLGVLPSATAPQ